jgi:hypothetical protein
MMFCTAVAAAAFALVEKGVDVHGQVKVETTPGVDAATALWTHASGTVTTLEMTCV